MKLAFLGLLAAAGISTVRSEVVAGFQWKYPFGENGGPPPGFDVVCEETGTFYARQHTLRDHMTPAPKGFMPWADALKPVFGGRPFPGSWDGEDAHGTLRSILVMDYSDVPADVKDWLRDESPGLFAVYDKPEEDDKTPVNSTADLKAALANNGEGHVMIFAAGALYDILPLWVAGESKCRGSGISYCPRHDFSQEPMADCNKINYWT